MPRSFSGTSGMQLRESLDVHLVDERLVPRRARRTIVAPGERGVDDGRQRRKPALSRSSSVKSASDDRAGSRTANRPTSGRAPIALAYGSSRSLLGLNRCPLRRLVRAMHAVAVKLAGNDVGKVAVPDLCCLLGERDGRRFLRVVGPIEQAELDLRRILREETEIDTRSVPRGSQGIWSSRPDAHEFLRRMRYFAAGGDAKLCHPLLTLIVRSATTYYTIYYAVAMPILTSHWLAHAALREKAILQCKSIVRDGTMTPPGGRHPVCMFLLHEQVVPDYQTSMPVDPVIAARAAGRGTRTTGAQHRPQAIRQVVPVRGLGGPADARVRETLERTKSLAIPPAWTERVDLSVAARARPGDRPGREKGESSTATTPAGGQCATRPSTAAWSPLARHCRESASRSDHDLALPGLPRSKVLAAVVRLLELSLIRVGNDEYARSNRSFGLTTMRNRMLCARCVIAMTQAKKNVVRAIESVAEPWAIRHQSVASADVHPMVLDAYLDGSMIETPRRRAKEEMDESLGELRPEETAVMTLLRNRLAGSEKPARLEARVRAGWQSTSVTDGFLSSSFLSVELATTSCDQGGARDAAR